jgi:predicted enzyme related to lactoylglutathione lyase
MKPADDIPGVGRFAILKDPQGAAFAVIKTEPSSANS